ncbi:hypothetical protein N5K55_02750 (plasmid) [Pseudomonas aeruginosa]|nr:hypothetical protein [Pseudomonas aeruginosa]
MIAEKFPASLRVYSLYAYVTKKGLLYDSLQIPGVPYQEHRDTGDGKAFIANLGVLMSVQGSYVEKDRPKLLRVRSSSFHRLHKAKRRLAIWTHPR